MQTQPPPTHNGMSLFAATMVGVGAIVGGGILALSGVAFATAGAGALVAFAANGLIAALTALSFAELAAAFPQSGGTYTFAKKVVPVGTAFAVGWIVYFASVVAGVLYALGFSAFALATLQALLPEASALLTAPWTLPLVAMAVTLLLSWRLYRSADSSGSLINVIKVAVFSVLIFGGVGAFFLHGEPGSLGQAFSPFLPFGLQGVVTAMGYTFIALQGFDLIASVAGEVKDARRNVPRAMLTSLGIAIAIYIPLLTVVLVVGVPEGETVASWARGREETVIADAAAHFLGPFGFWLVMLAGLLSMLSALGANLFAASRLAQAMARDRALPRTWQANDTRTGTPRNAILVTAAISLTILALLGDVSSAGAAASLIFLVSFALVNLICILARRRGRRTSGFRMPLHPWLPLTGLLACTSLALFQGVVVPVAGAIIGGWLLLGGFFYAFKLGQNARVYDAASEAADPELLALRGRNPLVLVPVANPASAEALAGLASRLASPHRGRVMLLNVIRRDQDQGQFALDCMAQVMRQSMASAMQAGVNAQALATLSRTPWQEIRRVARLHRCDSLLLGMSRIDEAALSGPLERLFTRLDCNVTILRAPTGWKVESARRILVPVSMRSYPNTLRARLLTHLSRHRGDCTISYLMIVPESLSKTVVERIRRINTINMFDEIAQAELQVVASDDPLQAIIEASAASDLVVVGLERGRHKQRLISSIPRGVLLGTDKAVLLVGQG